VCHGRDGDALVIDTVGIKIGPFSMIDWYAVGAALLEIVTDPNETRLPEISRACVAALGSQLLALKAQILAFDRRIMAWHRSNETSRRLDPIPHVGPALATALVASIADPKAFRSGRDFSAWIGLVPKQNSSEGKDKLGSISKQGDRYLPPGPHLSPRSASAKRMRARGAQIPSAFGKGGLQDD
jgi:transposase